MDRQRKHLIEMRERILKCIKREKSIYIKQYPSCSFRENRHNQQLRQQKDDETERNRLANKFPSNQYHEDVENDLAIYRQPRRKAGSFMEIQKLSGG